MRFGCDVLSHQGVLLLHVLYQPGLRLPRHLYPWARARHLSGHQDLPRLLWADWVLRHQLRRAMPGWVSRHRILIQLEAAAKGQQLEHPILPRDPVALCTQHHNGARSAVYSDVAQ